MGLSKTGRLNPAASGSVRPTDEDDFRIRPRKPKNIRETATALACISSMRAAQRISTTRPVRLLPQRCMVKVRYANSYRRHHTVKRWSRFGKYMQKEGNPSFDADGPRTDAPDKLSQWEESGDKRIFHVIVSPESSKADLEKLSRDLMSQVERDTGRPLEWLAAIHRHGDHPHTHIALRGRDRNGDHFRFTREYIQQRFRAIGSELCTEQLGPRRYYGQALTRRYALQEVPQLTR
jgi:type IV secretory pathway VirD2 relaxase